MQAQQHHPEADQPAGQLHRGGQAAGGRSQHPPPLGRDHQGGGAQAHHQQVVVQAADPMGEHQRARQDQRGDEGGVVAGPGRQPRQRPGQQRQAHQGQQPVPDDHRPGGVDEPRGARAPQQRQRAVRRRGGQPARVDGLDDRPGEHAGAPGVGGEPQPGQLALGRVAPAVAAEQGRGHQQRQDEQHGGAAHGVQVGVPVPGGPPQPDPGGAEQPEAADHHHETAHPPGHRVPPGEVGDPGAVGDGADHETAEEHEHRADDAQAQGGEGGDRTRGRGGGHGPTLGAPGGRWRTPR